MMCRAVWDPVFNTYFWQEEETMPILMSPKAYLYYQAKTYAACLRTSRAKSADYAGDNDPFRNFRLVEGVGLCSFEKGILVRMSDKFSRICNLLGGDRKVQVKDESVDDTLKDLITYAAILIAYRDTKKNGSVS